MAGANLQYTKSPQAWHEIMRVLESKRRPGSLGTGCEIAIKNGVPVNSVAADAPIQAGDFVFDRANDDVYISTAFTSTTQHTWVKISQ